VSDAFLIRFVALSGLRLRDPASVDIQLQKYDRDDLRVGITDIELRGRDLHLIVEAKRGWGLPSKVQLRKYLPILQRSTATRKRFVVLTRWGSESKAVVAQALGTEVGGFAIRVIGVGDIYRAARSALREERSHAPRLFLRDLLDYLEGGGYVTTRDNRVYVVPLSKKMSEIGTPFHRIPYERHVYWYGLRSGPKIPPTYVGFRFDGRLQSIHYVEKSQPFTRIRELYPKATFDWGPGVLLKLGPPFQPASEVRSGKLRDRRVWADVDLLFTCATVEQADQLTRERGRLAAD
jgi:hypothetical protein